nr:hypothetical protein [Streptomyces sp.]
MSLPELLCRAVRRVLRDVWDTCVLIGAALCGQQPWQDCPPRRAPAPPRPGHPERLADSIPLSTQERALWTDILGREPGTSRRDGPSV